MLVHGLDDIGLTLRREERSPRTRRRPVALRHDRAGRLTRRASPWPCELRHIRWSSWRRIRGLLADPWAQGCPGRRHARRPAELPPLPAARVPGGDRRAVAGRDRPPLRAISSASATPRSCSPRHRLRSRRGELVLAAARTATAATLPYDTLVVAGGSRDPYFGHDEWAAHARSQVLEGALDIRAESCARSRRPRASRTRRRRAAWLTFVVVGGGPTGVEMAGQIAELAATRCGTTSARSTRAPRASSSSRRPTACSTTFPPRSRRSAEQRSARSA